MSRKSIEPCTRRHVFFYDSDWDYLTNRFGEGAPSDMRLGVSATIREIVHAKVQELRRREINRIEDLALRNRIQKEELVAEGDVSDLGM